MPISVEGHTMNPSLRHLGPNKNTNFPQLCERLCHSTHGLGQPNSHPCSLAFGNSRMGNTCMYKPDLWLCAKGSVSFSGGRRTTPKFEKLSSKQPFVSTKVRKNRNSSHLQRHKVKQCKTHCYFLSPSKVNAISGHRILVWLFPVQNFASVPSHFGS